ncbi:MAG: SDR family oxidoreductase [Cytophagales bacterium]
MNKLAVVSGGTKGIGRAVVEKFASHGFDIATTARNIEDLQQLKLTIETKHANVNVHYINADLSVKTEVTKFADFILELNQPIALLVNNTGFYTPGQIHNEPDGQLELMLNTNLYSAYHLTRALIKNLLAAKKGHIFNICSTASITPYVNGGSYCISKFAMLGMSKVLREEMKPYNIKVTAILPGPTKTASWDGVDLPEERFIQATDVAETIFSAFQLSPAANIEEILIRPQLGDL